MSTQPNDTGLSPLEQIRQCEAEDTRRVAAAHEAAIETVEKARLDGAHLIQSSREAGRQDGQARNAEILARAEEEAEMLVMQAKAHANELRQQGDARMETAVRQAVEIILSLAGEGESP